MLNILDLGVSFGYPIAEYLFAKSRNSIKIHTTTKIQEIFKLYDDGLDLIIFGGGADIHTSLYGHKNVASSTGLFPTERDIKESVVFQQAVQRKIPMLGICRGSQFLCAMSGGFLIQHVSGHTDGPHEIATKDGHVYQIPSTHHQMQYPFRTKHELIAWSAEQKSRTYVYDNGAVHDLPEITQEPEIVFYPHTKALAIQGHPEYIDDPMHQTVQYCNSLIRQYLLADNPQKGLLQ